VGGWATRETAKRFADYAEHMGRRLGDRLAALATHNEPWCTAVLGHAIGQFAPGARDKQLAVQVAHHLLLSHGLALQAMRAAGVKAPLGIVLNQSPTTPATDSQADREAAEREYATFVRWFMDPIFLKCYPKAPGVTLYPVAHENDFDIIAQPLDFLGINYYTRIWASTSQPPAPAPKLMGQSDMGWENYPQGLTELLVKVNRDYKLPPVYITENGMADADVLDNGRVNDPARIDYVRTHLEALRAAMEAGVDVRGYFYWSLLDNYEWNSGYDKRFGLVHVDYETQKRTPKESARWYRDFIAGNR
jgi:beta-glucosidase